MLQKDSYAKFNCLYIIAGLRSACTVVAVVRSLLPAIRVDVCFCSITDVEGNLSWIDSSDFQRARARARPNGLQ